MTTLDRDDIVLPPMSGESGGPRHSPVVAFVPIALALFGIGLILFGGVRATDEEPAVVVGSVDFVVTGSIALPRDHRRDLEMLDL